MRLKELRRTKGYTQQKLADAVGVSRSAIAMWERGTDCGIEMASKLAALFDVSIDYLMERTDEPHGEASQPDSDVLSEKQYALLKKTNDFSDNEIEDLLDMANIVIARRNRI